MLRLAVLIAAFPLLAACDQIEDTWLAIRYPHSTILFDRCVARNSNEKSTISVDVKNECARRYERVISAKDVVLRAGISCGFSGEVRSLDITSDKSNRFVITAIEPRVQFAAANEKLAATAKRKPVDFPQSFEAVWWHMMPLERVIISPGYVGSYRFEDNYAANCRELAQVRYEDGNWHQWQVEEVRGLEVRIR